MGVESFIKRIATRDTAVYWASPTPAADGSNTYGAPVEIDCFWKNASILATDKDGKEVFIEAEVHVAQDLVEQGMLFHGTLADLTAAQEADPKKVQRAYEIRIFKKTPSIQIRGKFNRVAMLWRSGRRQA